MNVKHLVAIDIGSLSDEGLGMLRTLIMQGIDRAGNRVDRFLMEAIDQVDLEITARSKMIVKKDPMGVMGAKKPRQFFIK